MFDERRVEDTVLALMHLNAHKDSFGLAGVEVLPLGGHRRGLHERGLISDPRSKA